MASLAHLQGHAPVCIPGEASCSFPEPSSLLHIGAATQSRPHRAVPIHGQVFKSSQQLQSNPERRWNRITPARLSP